MKTKAHTQSNRTVMQVMLLVAGIFLTGNLWAQAGTSIFTYGKVELRHSSGEVSELSRGMPIESGETVLTGVNGRAQLRMQDGAIFDLKPNTEFLIEEYIYDNKRGFSGANLNANEDKGFYRLLRGGFRSISGLIGKRNKKNYRVTTPVATIGIRGTDYSADYCDAACASLGGTPGLFLSVASGGVVIANDGGSLDIDPGQTGFAASAVSAPVMVGGSSASADEEQASDLQLAKAATDNDGNVVSLETGNDPQQPAPPSTPMGAPGKVATSINGSVEQSEANGANIVTIGRDALTEFTTSDNTYNQGTSSIVNQGFDANTGLFWGRWSNGTAVATNAAGSSDVDLNSSSAHWVYTTNQVTPTIPLSGTANFDLVGNTNPTDNHGNSGVLGSASLSADFTNQTVDADVNLSINQETWDATATDVALDGEAATFAGEFDQVVITDENTGAAADGSGELNGFFTGDSNGEVSGAGMSYSLSDDVDTTVDGTASFEAEDVAP